MKVGDRVTLEWRSMGVLVETMLAPVREVRGDFVYVDIRGPGHQHGATFTRDVRAFHRRTGKPRKANGWQLATKHCDPLAGRGRTK